MSHDFLVQMAYCAHTTQATARLVIALVSRILKSDTGDNKGRTIRKVMGGMGNFQLAQIFFFAHCLCRNFFLGEPLCTNFFFRQILLFFEQWSLDSLSMFLCFINYSTLTTDQRIQATLMYTQWERRKPLGVDGFPVHFFSPCSPEFLSHSPW